jgi:hypothetical protein
VEFRGYIFPSLITKDKLFEDIKEYGSHSEITTKLTETVTASM